MYQFILQLIWIVWIRQYFREQGLQRRGGVTFLELLEAIRTVAQANVVGADVNELAPMLDASGVSTATACKVLRELLLAIAK